MKKLIDMHTHTNFSDGDYSPKELIELSKKENIKIMAITDHDTLEGIKNIPKDKTTILLMRICILYASEGSPE